MTSKNMNLSKNKEHIYMIQSTSRTPTNSKASAHRLVLEASSIPKLDLKTRYRRHLIAIKPCPACIRIPRSKMGNRRKLLERKRNSSRHRRCSRYLGALGCLRMRVQTKHMLVMKMIEKSSPRA